ncbi:ArsR/SmtB family transcription factor [Halobellus rufus]|uniref:ArsR/SmtB family transcription factor n=1 Tax=Halobellus rufus TaxID=1448860 RepID=UPI0009DED6F5|nr:helix-turn-helix domain-containing protein [Halobellus rufus]
MPTAFPHPNPVDHTPRERTSVVVDDDCPTNVLQTISSDTAQEILAALDDEPATTSDLAAIADTSIQNAKYHIEHLCEAGLVEAVDTRYSKKAPR